MLIRRALEVWTERGFNSLGLSELLSSVQVPKGSFYHYFDSKEAFAAQVVDAYDQFLTKKLQSHFSCPDKSALARLDSFVADAIGGLDKHGFRRGCLVGNLGQEMAGLDEGLREQLARVLQNWEDQVEELLTQAIDEGLIASNHDPRALASFFWVGWEGAILRARLERTSEPMTLFIDYFYRLCGAVDHQGRNQ